MTSRMCAYLIQLPVAKPIHPGYARCRRSAKAGRAMDVHLQALYASAHEPYVVMSMLLLPAMSGTLCQVARPASLCWRGKRLSEVQVPAGVGLHPATCR